MALAAQMAHGSLAMQKGGVSATDTMSVLGSRANFDDDDDGFSSDTDPEDPFDKPAGFAEIKSKQVRLLVCALKWVTRALGGRGVAVRAGGGTQRPRGPTTERTSL
jgi:hypothetical protein